MNIQSTHNPKARPLYIHSLGAVKTIALQAAWLLVRRHPLIAFMQFLNRP